MSTRTDGAAETAVESQAAAPAALSPTRPLYWSIRREVWENRSLYVAPLIVASVALLSFSVSAMVTLPRKLRALSALDPSQQPLSLLTPYSTVAAIIMLMAVIVGVFYCLDALQSERRDRSILFWKSLPVSDRTTVLSKMAVPLVVLPLIAMTLALAAQLFMFTLSTVIAVVSGAGVATLWTRLPLLQMWVVMVYGLVAHALWHAPIYAWFLLVSGWARRATFIWALLPVIVIGGFEHMAFNTSHVASWLRYRVMGAMEAAFAMEGQRGHVAYRFSQLDLPGLLGSPGLWNGLIASAIFITLAVRLRRSRDPI